MTRLIIEVSALTRHGHISSVLERLPPQISPMSWLKSFWHQLRPEGGELLRDLSPRAQQVLALAHQEAKRLNHNFIGTEHVLLGLIMLGQGTAVAVLENMGLNLKTVRQEVERHVGVGPDQKVSGGIAYTPRVKKVLALAVKESESLNHKYVGTEHILLGLLREGDGVAPRVLKNLGVDISFTRENILRHLDPNCLPQSEDTAMPDEPKAQASDREPIDISRRYDVYCREGEQEVIYRNALFKGVKTLFKEREYDVFSEYMELEQADGQIVFIGRASITKFCEHGQGPGPEMGAGGKV